MARGIWLLRHGDIGERPGRPFVGQWDLPLSGLGRRQFARLGRVLPDEIGDERPVAVLCSDLSRSMESAEILRRSFRPRPGEMPLVPDPGFREISLGAWEKLTRADIERRYPGALDERAADFAGYAPAGGESFSMLQRRVLVALLRARLNYPDGVLLLVGHAGVNRAILADYLALPLGGVLAIPQPYACRAYLENR